MAKGTLAAFGRAAPPRRPSPMQAVDRAIVALYGALLPDVAAVSLERVFHTPERYLMPENAHRFFTDNHASRLPYRGGTLYVWSWAPRGRADAPAVVMLHGWSGRAAEFHRFVGPLVEVGFRVAAFDMPGHGFSDGERSGLIDFAGAAIAVATAFGPVHGVLAHGLGAEAAALALTYDLTVRCLVFIAPALGLGAAADAVARRVGMPSAVCRRMQARIEKREGMAWRDLDTDRLVARATRAARAPLLVFHDRDDREAPWSDGRRIAAAAAEAQLVTTSGMGHRGLLADGTVVEDTVAFFLGGWPDDAEPPA